MRIVDTPLPGVYVIEPEPNEDERGLFARVLDGEEFARRGLLVPSTQWSVSFNRRSGTIRGMHYQASPHDEVKLIRCTRGAIFDVIVDLGARKWFGLELSAENRRSLYVPAGMAHGFQSLSDDAEVFYAIEGRYVPEAARGVRWDDAAFGIEWPQPPTIISERDRSFPPFTS
jgi:dTDP-4-dehydrorhamnose 3,5-epimerase